MSLVALTPSFGQVAEQGGAGQRAEMTKMAEAVTRAANTCDMMMQKEMAAMPWIMGAAIFIGAMLLIALALFIALEVQWLRYFGLRIKRERASLSSASRAS
ncbi:MAG: hypothetical protein ACREH8_07425 [Opitutaceae bacterium]